MEAIEKIIVDLETNIPVYAFILNFIIAFTLSFLLALIYQKYSFCLSNKEKFSTNLIIISITTMVMITIVKSSLALSLGLVGALSIIRFRTAIKEPEELSYIFIAITIGLGLGANQVVVTCIAFFLTSIVILLLFYFSGSNVPDQNMFLTIESNEEHSINIDTIVSLLKTNCNYVKLRRFEYSENNLEAIFLIQLKNVDSLKIINSSLLKINKNLKLSFLNQDDSLM